ncbi:MAG: hypothetical protein IMY73_02725 [Bacteroidetes bacterium]|nr:hypothetical protein [Bacteroidota bacterium]
MKNIKVLLLTMFFTSTVMVVFACRKIDRNVRAQLIPSHINLVEERGMVEVNFRVEIPYNFVRRAERFVFTPVLTDYNNIYELPSIVIDGDKFYKLLNEGVYKDSLDFDDVAFLAFGDSKILNYSHTFEFEEWMEWSNLICFQNKINRKETVVLDEQLYAKGVKVMRPTKKKVEKCILMMEEKSNSEIMKVYFSKNSCEVDIDYCDNMSELVRLGVEVNKIFSNSKNIIDNIVIVVSSSPEGNYKSNEKMAMKRAMTIKNYLKKTLELSTENLDKIEVICIAENWNYLKTLVSASRIKDKKKMLTVFDIQNLNYRENVMCKMSEYKYVKDVLFPQLRYATFMVNYRCKKPMM